MILIVILTTIIIIIMYHYHILLSYIIIIMFILIITSHYILLYNKDYIGGFLKWGTPSHPPFQFDFPQLWGYPHGYGNPHIFIPIPTIPIPLDQAPVAVSGTPRAVRPPPGPHRRRPGRLAEAMCFLQNRGFNGDFIGLHDPYLVPPRGPVLGK